MVSEILNISKGLSWQFYAMIIIIVLIVVIGIFIIKLMKATIKTILFIAAVLLIIGVVAFFWLFYPFQADEGCGTYMLRENISFNTTVNTAELAYDLLKTLHPGFATEANITDLNYTHIEVYRNRSQNISAYVFKDKIAIDSNGNLYTRIICINQ